MPFSSGLFERLYRWASDKVNAVKIREDSMDAEFDGIATGLSTCILKDGTQTITATVPWNSRGLTGVSSLTVTGSTASTTPATGAMVVTGGVGVGGALNVGGALGVASTGSTTLSSALTYGGVTLSNSVTGTGSMALSADPTFTGTLHAATVQTTNQPGFSAHKNGTDQVLLWGFPYKLTFETESHDIGSYYDAANSKWTPPAGMVFVQACVYCSADIEVSDFSPMTLHIYKNGVSLRAAKYLAGIATFDGCKVMLIDRANGTDYYEVYFNGTGTIAVDHFTVEGTSTDTYFSGFTL